MLKCLVKTKAGHFADSVCRRSSRRTWQAAAYNSSQRRVCDGVPSWLRSSSSDLAFSPRTAKFLDDAKEKCLLQVRVSPGTEPTDGIAIGSLQATGVTAGGQVLKHPVTLQRKIAFQLGPNGCQGMKRGLGLAGTLESETRLGEKQPGPPSRLSRRATRVSAQLAFFS